MRQPIRLVVVASSLLLPLPVFAHHKGFYQRVFFAIEKGDIETIKDLCSKPAWEGNDGTMPAADLQKRLKGGKITSDMGGGNARSLREYSSSDDKRSRCLVTFRLQYPDKSVERIWLLAEDVDPREGSWEWRIVRIINDEKQAQAFFEHQLPAD